MVLKNAKFKYFSKILEWLEKINIQKPNGPLNHPYKFQNNQSIRNQVLRFFLGI